jgi:hypothetical protein
MATFLASLLRSFHFYKPIAEPVENGKFIYLCVTNVVWKENAAALSQVSNDGDGVYQMDCV